MDYKKVFEQFKTIPASEGFIKTTSGSTVESSQKAALNLKGNGFFNAGKIEEARRIFLTTGYTDGLARVGDYYKKQGRILDALKMYWIAPDHTKAEPLIAQLSDIIRQYIHEGEGNG